MGNNFFRFKQFVIYQDQCAMKVCTDACLLGAVVADWNDLSEIQFNSVLDIGAGTGLLSLMLAQKIDARIDSIEIDEAAFQQMSENISRSEWSNRISCYNMDILHYDPEKNYDLIISNPPFFGNDLKSADQQKNKAKHDTTLSLHQLIEKVSELLSSNGVFAILLPQHRLDECEQIAKQSQLFLNKKLLVKQTSTHGFFRGILFFSGQKGVSVVDEMTIKNEKGEYTETFSRLLKDYYL